MKYTILINQVGIVESGLHKKTDVIDWMIIDYLQQWYFSERGKTIFNTDDNNHYVWINYNHMINAMPLLGIKDKSAITHRLKKLKNLNLIKTFQTKDNTLYYIITPKCMEVIGFKSNKDGNRIGAVDGNEQPVDGNEQPVDENEQPVDGNRTGAVDGNRTAQSDNYIKQTTKIRQSDININTKEKEKPSLSQSQVLELYHKILPELPRVVKWTNTRKTKMRTCLLDKERQSIDFWEKYFNKVKNTPFLLGENNHGWKADLEWLIKESNLIKVLDGKYDRNGKGNNGSTGIAFEKAPIIQSDGHDWPAPEEF